MTADGFVLSVPATTDLSDIRDHIDDDPRTAMAVHEDIRTAIQRVIEFPYLGHVRDG